MSPIPALKPALAALITAAALSAGWSPPAGAHACQDIAVDAPVRWVPAPYPAGRRVLKVGPQHEFKTPSEAARASRDGDVIEIEAGDYTATTLWTRHELWIRGVNGRPHLVAPAQLAQSKAIWVIGGRNVTVENVEFSGAKVPARNGAGIRAQGQGLTVRAACFRGNENGILTTNKKENWLVVEFSEFARNGSGDGKSHNLYVGKVDLFEMRYSYSHGARVGHLVKSRALRNLIEFNRLVDDSDGTASYELDLPSGGDALVRGNLIVQGPASPNQTIVSYAAEAKEKATGRLVLAYNTLFSLRRNPVFVTNRATAPVLAVNNAYGGAAGKWINGPSEDAGNVLVSANRAFRNVSALDFRPAPGSALVDAAKSSGAPGEETGPPLFEPSVRLGGSPRRSLGAPDVGAFECCAAGQSRSGNR
jgi:hypothetical protein